MVKIINPGLDPYTWVGQAVCSYCGVTFEFVMGDLVSRCGEPKGCFFLEQCPGNSRHEVCVDKFIPPWIKEEGYDWDSMRNKGG